MVREERWRTTPHHAYPSLTYIEKWSPLPTLLLFRLEIPYFVCVVDGHISLSQSWNSIMSSKTHQRPPFRAEHLGSLLRPSPLLDVRHKIDKGEKGLEQDLKSIEDASVNEIVKEQLDLGFHAVSDGEYRRHMFWWVFQTTVTVIILIPYRGTFFPGLDGFEEIQNPDIDIFRMYVPDIAAFTESGHKPGETVICTGKIKHVGSTYVDQWNYLKNLLPKDRQHEAKLTLAAPNW